MNIKKTSTKIMTYTLSFLIATSCFSISTFAQEVESTDVNSIAITQSHNNEMRPFKTVTPIGTKSFYKIDTNTNTVIYADRDDETGWKAIPSAYIDGSPYNEQNISYGAYIVNSNEVVFVPLADCTQTPQGTYEYRHGTKDEATVSTDVDTATNSDPNMGTDFYINIQNGIDPDGPSKDDTINGSTDDERVSYDITVRTKTSYQLNATVPMYVCMYGYRGTGNVVTPDSDAYKLKNYSTVNNSSNATITEIVKLTKYSQILDNNHSNEQLAAIAYNKKTGEYIWWYSKPSEKEIQALGEDWVYNGNIENEKLNASGQCYVIYIDDKWDFKVAGILDDVTYRQSVDAIDDKHPLTNDFTFENWNFGKTPAVGDSLEGGQVEGMPIKITELQAEPATWRMVDKATDIKKLSKGELVMTLAPKTATDNSAIDLSKCSAPIDITSKGWLLNAPNVENDGTVKEENVTVLPLITNARMAGSNINPAGCTSVVRVIYTVTPIFNEKDNQSNLVVNNAK